MPNEMRIVKEWNFSLWKKTTDQKDRVVQSEQIAVEAERYNDWKKRIRNQLVLISHLKFDDMQGWTQNRSIAQNIAS